MLKMMVFIDGTWFDTAVKRVCGRKQYPFIEKVQFEPIWKAITEHARNALAFDIDLVRAYCVAGYPDPETVGPKSKENATRILAGWNAVRDEPRMAVELYPYNYFKGEFPGQDDRDAGNAGRDRVAKEKCVDVALATNMLYFAAIPGAYDIAVLVSGDRDYIPVLRAVRNLGKRTMLASFLEIGSCALDLRGDRELWDIRPLELGPVLKQQASQAQGSKATSSSTGAAG